VAGILLTMFDRRTRLADDVVADVRAHFSHLVYEIVIPRSVRLSEAPGYGRPITSYDPTSMGARAYRSLAEEVVTRTNNHHTKGLTSWSIPAGRLTPRSPGAPRTMPHSPNPAEGPQRVQETLRGPAPISEIAAPSNPPPGRSTQGSEGLNGPQTGDTSPGQAGRAMARAGVGLRRGGSIARDWAKVVWPGATPRPAAPPRHRGEGESV
jgi:hypothetical protein